MLDRYLSLIVLIQSNLTVSRICLVAARALSSYGVYVIKKDFQKMHSRCKTLLNTGVNSKTLANIDCLHHGYPNNLYDIYYVYGTALSADLKLGFF